MKLSEIEQLKERYDVLRDMRDQRRNITRILDLASDDASGHKLPSHALAAPTYLGEVSIKSIGCFTHIHPEAMDHWRMAITESIRLIERDLLAAGIEIDKDVIKGVDTDDFVDQTYGRYKHLNNRIIQG